MFGDIPTCGKNHVNPMSPFMIHCYHRKHIDFARTYVCPARTRRVPNIQKNVPAIYTNALPPNITSSSNPGYLTPPVSGAHAWAEWLHHPCLLQGPQHGDKRWGKGGDNQENMGKLCPPRPAR